MNEKSSATVLEVSDLRMHYRVRNGFLNLGAPKYLKAVDGVSFNLLAGETLGIVGESGCGKSSLARAIIRLQEPTSGTIRINNESFTNLKGRPLRRFRQKIQMVFQDPYGSLDPRMLIFDAIAEPVKAHRKISRNDLRALVSEYLILVGLDDRALNKYPHEFSGGQRQRIAIARALILNPKILIADEPVSALDVSIQAQVLNLIKDLQTRLKLSLVFISHNLAVVKYVADQIAVMYLGKIVEMGPSDEIYRAPKHPYTRALLSAIPVPNPELERKRIFTPLTGEPPSAINPPRGCAFQSHCPWVQPHCREKEPALAPISSPAHFVSCFEADRAAD